MIITKRREFHPKSVDNILFLKEKIIQKERFSLEKIPLKKLNFDPKWLAARSTGVVVVLNIPLEYELWLYG